MATLLLKTEPSTYSYADLVRDGQTMWDGVTNNTALIHIRRAKKGDRVLIYHTGEERRVVGLGTLATDPYEDPSRPGVNGAGEPKFAVFDLVPAAAAKTPLTLEAMKGDARFADFDLLRISRLSVVPVPAELDRIIRELAGLPKR